MSDKIKAVAIRCDAALLRFYNWAGGFVIDAGPVARLLFAAGYVLILVSLFGLSCCLRRR